MELSNLVGAGVIMHDLHTFPSADVRIGISDVRQEITHELKDGIAIISFSNNYFMGSSPYSIESYARYINNLKSDSNVHGLIFEQFSGGGTAVAGALLNSTFQDFKKVKPIINLAHIAASASYWSATGGNLIIASTNMSSVGSIGALISLDKISRLIDLNFYDDVYAEQSKDKNKAWRDYLEDPENKELYKKQATEAAQIFIDSVKAARPFVKDAALSGSMYNAVEAKSMGLIDGIGSISYCIERMKSLIKDYK